MRNTAIISPPSGGLEKCSFSEKIQFCAHLLLHVGKPMDTWFAFPTWRNTFDFSPLSIQFSVYLMESKNAIGFPMAFGTGKGCWYFTSAPFILPVFDFLTSHRVPCLWKHWFYWTISCFLIRRRGKVLPLKTLLPFCAKALLPSQKKFALTDFPIGIIKTLSIMPKIFVSTASLPED